MDRIRIEGRRVTLRPLVVEELDASIAGRLAAGPKAHPATPDREKLRQRFEGSGVMRDGWLDLAIDLDGARIGEIQTYVPPNRVLEPGTYEVGILIDEPHRGRGYGSQAVLLLLGWLFGEAGAVQVNMPTADDNTAMRTVLERLGFVADGTIEDYGQTFVFYSVTRDAWQPVAHG